MAALKAANQRKTVSQQAAERTSVVSSAGRVRGVNPLCLGCRMRHDRDVLTATKGAAPAQTQSITAALT